MTRARDDQKGAGSAQRPGAAEIERMVADVERPAPPTGAVQMTAPPMDGRLASFYGPQGAAGNRDAKRPDRKPSKPPRNLGG